jgi:hypothetical protein
MLLWLLAGVAGYVAYELFVAPSSSSPSGAQPGGGATSPPISYAGGSTLRPVQPLPSGLPAGWYWEDQQNQAVPYVGQMINAIAMTPDDIASTVYGNATAVGGNVTFRIAQVIDPGTGLVVGQMMTLPLSYVVPT